MISYRNPIEDILNKLGHVKETGGGYVARCPAHDDHNPSLSVSEGKDGRVLLKCHAGCSTKNVLDALGLDFKDLYADDPASRSRRNGHSKPTAIWEVKDPEGMVQAEHVRFDYPPDAEHPEGYKKVLWRLPGGEFKDGLKGREITTLPLYGSEHVKDYPEDEPIVITEGEKAADALLAAGVNAVGTVTGTSSMPKASVLEVLRGRRIILWPDNDDVGREHMERITAQLHDVAEEVRIFEWEDAPPKGDAADHPEVKRGMGPSVRVMLASGSQARKPRQSIDSRRTEKESGENRSILPIKTVEEVISEAGEETPWIIENILTRGALTEFSGLAKKGGKTTFWCHAIAASARGGDHAGFHTTPARFLYLTEQGNNFAGALRDSGLEEYTEHIRVVQFKDVSAVEWEPLMERAGAETKRLGFDALVVDTFAVFARLKGSEENESGPVADRMRVLRQIAQTFDIAVVVIRHSGKDGTPRGSSAFEAEADICVTLARPEGRHDPSVRRITGIGRYGEWERNIQLVGGHYISLGTDDKVEFNRAVRFIKSVLPQTSEDGMKKQDMLNKRTGPDEQISASTFDRALKGLVKQGDVGEKQLMDRRGKPKVYWLAYKPPGLFTNGNGTRTEFGENKPDGSREDPDIHFHQTLSSSNVNGENKSHGISPEDFSFRGRVT